VSALNTAAGRALIALAVFGLAFALYTQAVAGGVLMSLDLAVARGVAGVWRPWLEPVAQVVAVAGGVEVTVVIAALLAWQLWRRGYRSESAALLALPAALAIELVYKFAIRQPAPAQFAHADGPSLVTMLHTGTLTLSGSYPSGHMMRTVLVYGLGAFVVGRLAPPGLVRTLAAPLAGVLIGVMALDRVFLGVHWQSDVVGGLLLGGAVLAAAIAWLDRPRAAA
jgi:undecaprenyl-diphosphatase